MNKYTWEKVEWENAGELVQLLMSGKNIYLSKECSEFAWYNGGRINESPFRYGDQGFNFGYTYSGIGYIKKEADWTDVISKFNPIFMINRGTGTIHKWVGVAENNTNFRPATLNEVKSYVWECMQDD